MYQDWKQWARLVYAILLLVLVWHLLQPDMLQQAMRWEEQNSMGKHAALLQTVLLVISAGLMIPKAKRLEPLDTRNRFDDSTQFALGLIASIIAFTIALL